MNQPRVRNVACAAVLVFLAAVGALIRYQAGWPLNPLASLGHSSSAEGRGELRAFRRDPVLDFRAPSTRLRSVTEQAGGSDWWDAEQPTEIRRIFSLDGEPGEAIDAYRVRAEASGWRLVATECSFVHRSTSVTLTDRAGGQQPGTGGSRRAGLPVRRPRRRWLHRARRQGASGVLRGRQSADGQPDDRKIVIDEAMSDGPRGAWVDTRIGPVEISGGATSGSRNLDARQVMALAELLARPAA